MGSSALHCCDHHIKMELGVVPTQCGGVWRVSAKIVPIFAQIWRVSGYCKSVPTRGVKNLAKFGSRQNTPPFSFYYTLHPIPNSKSVGTSLESVGEVVPI